MTTRRTFLHRLGIGLMGSAAFVLKPATLLAGCRGRRAAACPAPMGGFPPVSGGGFVVEPGGNLVVGPAVGAAAAGPGAPPRVLAGGDISLEYPGPPASGQTGEIASTGSFCVWGELGSNLIYLNGLSVQDTSGNPLSCTVTNISTWLNGVDNLSWGYAVEGLSTTGKFNLVISYFKSNGMGGVTPLSQTFGPFTLVSALLKHKK